MRALAPACPPKARASKTMTERPSDAANDLEVRLSAIDQRPDPDIARDAIAAITNELPIFLDTIKVVVKEGWVTLEGQVEWQ